jgi:hypothetical protein
VPVRGRDGPRPGAAASYAASSNPFTLVAAELDGDGFVDLATTCESSGSLSLLLNRGDCTFATARSYTARGATIRAAAADCDADDDIDLVAFNGYDNTAPVFFNRLIASRDAHRDGIPDACERRAFHRGDPNDDGSIDIADAIHILTYLFASGPPPACMESTDVNNSAAMDIADAVYLLAYLFGGGPARSSPGPPGSPCGADPDKPGSPGDLGCDAYDRCGGR